MSDNERARRSGQLDGQRDAVQSPADLEQHLAVIWRDRDRPVGGGHPLDEQLDRTIELQRRNTMHSLTGDTQWFA